MRNITFLQVDYIRIWLVFTARNLIITFILDIALSIRYNMTMFDKGGIPEWHTGFGKLAKELAFQH
jgi:hypothetical protein